MSTRFEAIPLTSGGHHFFGYYDQQPWSGSGACLLTLCPPFADREPGPDDRCEIGLVQVASGSYEPLAQTRAWNFQQGCQLHWHPRWPDDVILYNDRIGDRFVAIELNIRNGGRRILPRPISAVDQAGNRALSLNFGRLTDLRPGYGYSGVPDAFAAEPAPERDGVYVMDLATGEHELVLTYAELAAAQPDPRTRGSRFWLNHTIFSDDGQRFAVICGCSARARAVRLRRRTIKLAAMYTAGVSDGAARRRVFGPGLVSHYDWRGSDAILAFATHGDEPQPRFWLVSEQGEEPRMIAPDRWTLDGHCSYSPDRNWIVKDTYPRASDPHQELMLYQPESDRMVALGTYLSPPAFRGPMRCDLHPRFSRDGRWLCFDSAHSGVRQMYLLDVSELTAPSSDRVPAAAESAQEA